ncbi:hypothetical protein QAD02_013971 [Eretmocerus hayati]|uniref:Uncharacterized protein n=1 Tax=Eretmocerus hayati TaxID=131215 RepID=A0ACC2P6I4_9HYME|nr:hypothetical protein QAD02_013971 [Eretmocerus hayati]
MGMNPELAIDFTSVSHPLIRFELDELRIKVDWLEQYFPGVEKLKYSENGQTVTILPHQRQFSLLPNIKTYEVHHADPGVDEDNEVIKLVKELFQGRYTYEEISRLLKQRYGIIMSVRTLQRTYSKLQLKRKNIIESDLCDIISAIMIEMVLGPALGIGYKYMWQRLRQKYGLTVKQETVLELLRIIDPEGIAERSKYCLLRRVYSVLGPNFLWHVDGFDKLKHFGFAITGCVCGFSRKVIWLGVGTSNNKPEVIAWYILQAIKEFGCLPCIIRSDRGTENVKIELLQITLRSDHDDENANESSFLKGKSTANERIEEHWKQLINHTKNLSVPCGIPDVMYYCPDKYGAEDCGKDVNLPMIDVLIADETIAPRLHDEDIEEFVQTIFPNSSPPKTIQEAHELYMTLTEKVDTL